MKFPYSDEQVIEGIKARNGTVLRFLYSEYREKTIDYVTHNSGSVNEAEDVFQDAVVKAYQEIMKNDFVLKKTFNAYFMSICRNTWIYAVKLKNKQISPENFQKELTETNLFEEYKNEQLQKLTWNLFRQLNEDCQAVLDMYYFQKKAMIEIAYRMDYKNEQIAKNKKYRCLEYLKEQIKNHPVYKSLSNE